MMTGGSIFSPGFLSHATAEQLNSRGQGINDKLITDKTIMVNLNNCENL